MNITTINDLKKKAESDLAYHKTSGITEFIIIVLMFLTIAYTESAFLNPPFYIYTILLVSTDLVRRLTISDIHWDAAAIDAVKNTLSNKKGEEK